MGEIKGGDCVACCGIHRVEKRNRGAVYGLQIEANRKIEDYENGRDFEKSDIDWDKTEQNNFLIKCDKWNREISNQIKKTGAKEKKNSVVLLDGVYTASPEFFKDKTREEIEQYFRDCLEFHVRHYCKDDRSKVINAVVHYDEKTPHLHVSSVPIFEDEKGVHLSARDIMGGRDDYMKRQDLFFEEVSKNYNLERGDVEKSRSGKAKKHTQKREWQIAEQEREVEENEKRMQNIKRETERQNSMLRETNKQLENKKKELRNIQKETEEARQKIGYIETLKAIKEVLTDLYDYLRSIREEVGFDIVNAYNDDRENYGIDRINFSELLGTNNKNYEIEER